RAAGEGERVRRQVRDPPIASRAAAAWVRAARLRGRMGAPGIGRRWQGRGRIGRQDGGRGRRAPSQGRPRRSRGDEFLSRSMPGGVVIVAAAAWLNALMGAGFLQVFGVYVVALQDAFGWQASALAGSFAVQRASTAIASPLVGAWLRRFGPRRVALAGVAAFALGTAILGSVRSLAALFAVMPLLGLATTAMGPLTHTSALMQRFTRRRATAVAWTLTGVGLGGLLVPAVALLLLREGMPSALLVVGAIALLTGVPAAWT